MRFWLPRRHRIGNNSQRSVPRCIRCPPARRAYFPRRHRSSRADLAEFSIRFTASYPAGGASVAATSGPVAPVKSLFASVAPSARAVHGFGPSVQVTRPRGQAAESKVHANDSARSTGPSRESRGVCSPAKRIVADGRASQPVVGFPFRCRRLSGHGGQAIGIPRQPSETEDVRSPPAARRPSQSAPRVRQFSSVSRRRNAQAPGGVACINPVARSR